MLQDKFYTITSITIESNSIDAMLQLNEKHIIFEGHFPGQPVVPGVFMMQIVHEVCELATGEKLQLAKADLKFLMVIDPGESNMLQLLSSYAIQADGSISVSASLLKDKVVCFKFKGLFKAMGAPGER